MNKDIEIISLPLQLPNGVTVPNRLAKAAMAEGMGRSGLTSGHLRLYRQWAEGGWGIVISGNVQVDPRHLATPFDLRVTDDPRERLAYSHLASTNSIQHEPALLLMQISHPGLQSSATLSFSRPIWEPAIAPCSARPYVGDGILGWIYEHLLWPKKSRKVESVEEWLKIVDQFVHTAEMAAEASWDGVQIHSAHGYLLAEYLSPLTNPNPTPLPGVPPMVPLRLHPLYLILRGIHQKTQKSFVKSVKVNCSDFVQGGLDEKQASEIIKNLASWDLIDIIEISGGNYSSPAFASAETLSLPLSKRQSLFAHFTTFLLPSLPPPPLGPAILLTGGLHRRRLIASSLRERACDLVGIGRPACLVPDIPMRIILNIEVPDDCAEVGGYTIPQSTFLKFVLGGSSKAGGGIPLVGAGISTMWHTWQMCRIGRGVQPDREMPWLRGLIIESIWKGMAKREGDGIAHDRNY
ncbi:hypothetical protein L204_101025 [Cryptococcus depauperatus]|nr:NADH:flavin oxidoreductase/NADH oxidase [Cryptococcus depauperatus CBS 7855]